MFCQLRRAKNKFAKPQFYNADRNKKTTNKIIEEKEREDKKMMYGENNNVREQSMEELRNMYNYFSVKAAQYDELDRLEQHVNQGIRIKNASKIWGLILTIFGGCAFPIGLASVGSTGTIVSLAIIGLGILLLICHSSNKKNAIKTLEAERQRIAQLGEELLIHYNNYGYCPLGVEYTYPRILESIYEVFRQGRADTFKEAINLMANDAHQAEMERLQRSTAQAAWQTSASSAVTAGFTVANYIQNHNS